MRTIQLTLEYDGTDYVGWQIQANGRSIQGELERALAALLKERVKATGAGRTDAGVHALGQAASLRTESRAPLKAFVLGLNSLLPRDIAVRAASERPPEFDARRSARGKIYRYRVVNRPVRTPLAQRYAWELYAPLDDAAMARAARPLLGRHDFSAFRASDCEAPHAVRELRKLSVAREGEEVILEVEATAFLKHMVRNLVGTLVEVGQGRRAESSIAELLASRDRGLAGATAPARGLCLVQVFYEGEGAGIFPEPRPSVRVSNGDGSSAGALGSYTRPP